MEIGPTIDTTLAYAFSWLLKSYGLWTFWLVACENLVEISVDCVPYHVFGPKLELVEIGPTTLRGFPGRKPT